MTHTILRRHIKTPDGPLCRQRPQSFMSETLFATDLFKANCGRCKAASEKLQRVALNDTKVALSPTRGIT